MTNRNPVQHVAVEHQWRLTVQRAASSAWRADEALLRVVLGLPSGTPLRWQTCAGAR